jgi:hypothetical protein
MAKPVSIPNTFAAQTGNIPLSQLDSNFTTVSTALNDYQTYANYAVDSGAVNAMVITLSPAPTNQASLLGVVLTIQVNITNTLTPTLNVNAFGAQSVLDQAGNSISAGYFGAGRIISVVWNGTNYIWQGLVSSFALRSYIAGCTLSTAGSSITMSIAAGQATDSTNTVLMTLSAIAKTTAAWVVGTAVGGLDTGAIANSTWYHFYMIRRPDTGITDVVFSLSASAPTLPTNYTQYRRIGAGLTNGSGQWVLFVQIGDDFYWTTVPTLDVNTTTLGATATTFTLTNVPAGVRVLARMNMEVGNASTASVYLYPMDVTDQAITAAASPLATVGPCVAGSVLFEKVEIYTNTSAQIRAVASAASSTLRVAILGYRDTRGKDS